MAVKDVRHNVLPLRATFQEVLDLLNSGVSGIVFLEDDLGRVRGIFTDGDTRRAVLSGATLDSPARSYMQETFVHAREGQPSEDYMRLLTERIRHLPILDADGRLVDFISWADFWKRPVMEPTLGGNELKYVSDCINTGWISSQGQYVSSFENEFAAWHGAENAASVTNGTAALHLALLALGIGPGDEVLVPDVTFAATANAVIHCGATPVLVDIHPDHWTIDPEMAEEAVTERTRAIIPVHLYGQPCDMDPIMDLARRRDLFVVEDCAEALGATYRGKLVGTIGDMGCYSFFSNKVITTGEGGMVVSRDAAMDERVRTLRDHGMSKGRRYWHEEVGYNYRMTNLQAAVGLAQLEQIDSFYTRREAISQRYAINLEGLYGITLQPRPSWAGKIMWLYTLLVDDKLGVSRDDLMNGLAQAGVDTRPVFPPLHQQPPYRLLDREFPVADRIARQGLSLPSGVGLRGKEVDFICDELASVIGNRKTIDRIGRSA